MSGSIRYLPSAIRDLTHIHGYISMDDPRAADRLVERIEAAASRLKDYPGSAPLRPELGAGIRSLTIGRYLLLYHVAGSSVEVIRVVHASRDLAALFSDLA